MYYTRFDKGVHRSLLKQKSFPSENGMKTFL